MKRKTITIITALVLSISLFACGKDTSSTNNSDAETIKELEERIEELEAEYKELKAQLKDNQQSEENNQQSDNNEAASLMQTIIESPETSGVCGTNLTWYYQNGVLVIKGTGEMTNFGHTELYNSDGKKTVDEYDIPWYELKNNIGWVIMDEGVTSIGRCAFENHEVLSKLVLPSTLASIGYNSFENCGNLKEITYKGQAYTLEEFKSLDIMH
ncbi:MAG: leucine-rich repeat protein [Lachnospiraceae bacterium]|nr:leucine-rich repeat protein [Lachnospiraceae bacterium]